MMLVLASQIILPEEEAEKHHRQQFQAHSHQASCFSTSLRRRKLSDNKLVPALLGFVCEGIRFAFSHNEDDEEDEVVLGSWLIFLSLLSKYTHWVKSSDLNFSIAIGLKASVIVGSSVLADDAGDQSTYYEDSDSSY